jgi:uncharacterized protein (TIGR02145 family)
MNKKSRFIIYPLAIIGMFLILTNSCKKDENNNPTPTVTVPVLTTSAVSNITQTTASCGGSITSDGGSAVIARGVCWSAGTTPTIADNKTTDGTGTGSFTSAITGLILNNTYYVRAYATNSAGTGYGSALSFIAAVTDIDGNVYHTVTIGTQEWMVENLKVTKYRNGNPIPNVSDGAEWNKLTTGACCDYDNTASYSTTYGKLYNWYAVDDSRNIAPTGWHVATDAEWTILATYLGGDNIAGGKLKETGFTHWRDPNTGATNESGFTALPAGTRFVNGMFSGKDNNCGWWSATEGDLTSAWSRNLSYNASNINRSYGGKIGGLSVRCLRD